MILTLWVDPQMDFVDPAAGALGVPGGPERITAMNQYMREHERVYVLSRCQHSPETDAEHFELYGEHCVKGTPGAAWHHRLQTTYASYIIDKGQTHADPSPWDGATAGGLTIPDIIERDGITEMEIGGFVAEVCVKAAWQGAVAFGIPVTLLVGCTAALDAREGMRSAVREAIGAGVFIG